MVVRRGLDRGPRGAPVPLAIVGVSQRHRVVMIATRAEAPGPAMLAAVEKAPARRGDRAVRALAHPRARAVGQAR